MANLLAPMFRHSSTTRIIYFQCFAFILFQCVVAYPVKRERQRPWLDPNSKCQYEGVSDIYGLGIRLGVYCQWMASLLSKRFRVPSNLKILRDLLGANIIFLLSVFVATAVLSTGHVGKVYPVEILILHHIFFGGAYMVSFDQLFGGARHIHVTFWSVATMITVCAGMSIHTIWFWFGGVKELPKPDCWSYAFAFTKIPLSMSYTRSIFQTAAIVNTCVWGMGFCMLVLFSLPFMFSLISVPCFATSAALERWRNRNKRGVSGPDRDWRDRNQGHGRYVLASIIGILGTSEADRAKKGLCDEGSVTEKQDGSALAKPKPKSKNNWGSLFSLLVLIYSIVAIELIIQWSSIANVYTINSTGQVIPLVIGAGILIKTIFAIIAHHLNESPFSSDKESFRLKCKRKWVSFPINKPKRRHSWTAPAAQLEEQEQQQHQSSTAVPIPVPKPEQQQQQEQSSTSKGDEKAEQQQQQSWTDKEVQIEERRPLNSTSTEEDDDEELA